MDKPNRPCGPRIRVYTLDFPSLVAVLVGRKAVDPTSLPADAVILRAGYNLYHDRIECVVQSDSFDPISVDRDPPRGTIAVTACRGAQDIDSPIEAITAVLARIAR